MESGNILSNFRTRTIPNTIVESDITGEIQTVEEFLEFPGVYGFRLNEVPRTDLQGITSVIRNEDNQVFTWIASDTPSNNNYGFDYNNPLPIVYFPSSEVGKTFTIAYKGTGGAYTPSNIINISVLSGDIHERLINSIRTNILDYSLVNQNVLTYNDVITVNNLTITGTCIFRTNTSTAIGIVEVLGDLTLSNFAILKTIRVILIVHGSINCPIGTAQIVGQAGFNGGNASATNPSDPLWGSGGGGGAGTGQNGSNGIAGNNSGTGGNGGYALIDQYTQINNAQGVNGSLGNGGGGGYYVPFPTSGVIGGNGGFGSGSGGGGAAGGIYTSAGSLTSNSICHGSGGRGGNGNGALLAGVGGGSGGSSVIIICLGDISSNVTLYSGRNGLNGTSGNSAGAIQPYSGNIVLYSRYANGDIPATLDANGTPGANNGTIYREQIGKSSKMTGFIINNLLSELGNYGYTTYGLWNKLARDI